MTAYTAIKYSLNFKLKIIYDTLVIAFSKVVVNNICPTDALHPEDKLTLVFSWSYCRNLTKLSAPVNLRAPFNIN